MAIDLKMRCCKAVVSHEHKTVNFNAGEGTIISNIEEYIVTDLLRSVLETSHKPTDEKYLQTHSSSLFENRRFKN